MEKEVPFIYFHNIIIVEKLAFEDGQNNLPNYYLCVCDKIEQQCELFLPALLQNEEIFMKLLFGIRRMAEKILKKAKKK